MGDKDMKNEKSSWSELPEDLIVSITERLHVVDRIRFRAVCKNWYVQSAPVVIKAVDKLPWAMEYKCRKPNPMSMCDSRSNHIKLYKPFHDDNVKVSYLVESGSINATTTTAHASRDGWFLLDDSYEGKLFFVNPFTKMVKYLPREPLRSSIWAKLAMFSSSPVSFYFFVFVAYNGDGDDEFYVEIYSHMHDAWKTYNSSSMTTTNGRIGRLRAVCYDMALGMFYCHFDSFHLAIFDMIAEQEEEEQPSITMTTHSPLDDGDDTSSWELWRNYLLECRGSLFLVYLSHCLHKLYVMKLDWLREEWVRVNNLPEGYAMFVGDTSSFCVSAGGENTEIVSNRVYYHHEGVLYFQTLNGNG